MELTVPQLLWIVVASGVGWYLVANFIHGVKLFPRTRDRDGKITEYWLHSVEALLWPLALPAWIIIWSFIWLGRGANVVGKIFFNLGKVFGNAEPSRMERRLNEHVPRPKSRWPEQR